jgi:multiple sugar transport system permease protein
MIVPVIQFCIFYIGVNFNSILLAFKNYDYLDGSYSFVGFENFRQVFYDLRTIPYLRSSLVNSLVLYFLGLFGSVLALFFSFYISKRWILSGVFRVVLFLPSIISSIVLVLMFKYFVERAIPAFTELLFHKETQGLLSNLDTQLGTIRFYCIWSGFATNVMLYTGAMSGISDSLYEAAKLDGANTFQEFWHISLPMIFPTITTFLVTGIAGIFVNQMNLYNFYGLKAEYNLYTFGYYLYQAIQQATIADYPYLSSMGLILTMVAIPLTYLVKFLLEKYGPSAD